MRLSSQPQTILGESAQLMPNRNHQVPSAAILAFTCKTVTRATVRVSDGVKRWRIEFGERQPGPSELPLVGFRAGRTHVIGLELNDQAGNSQVLGPFEFRSPELPKSETEFPTISVTRNISARLEPGITLFSLRRRNLMRAHWRNRAQFDFTRLFGMLVAIDSDGHVVWSYKGDARIAGVEMLANGNLMFHTTEFLTYEVNILGETVRAFYAARRPQGPAAQAIPIDAASIHHQPHQKPDGNFLAMTANARVIENYYTSETDPNAPRKTMSVVGDRIIEFTPDGREVWAWNAFDHLDTDRIGFNLLDPYWHTRGFPHHADWTHGNGVTYDERTDRVIVSLKHQDAILGINRATGEIAWILGDHGGWPQRLQNKLLSPIGNLRWPWHMHNPRITHRGTIVLYDNGTVQARPFDKPKAPHETYSRAVEYSVDEANMTVRQIWASSDRLDSDSVSVWAMGDAHILPKTQNALVMDSIIMEKRDDLQWNEWSRDWHPDDFPYRPRLREYATTNPPEVLWETWIENPSDTMSWEVFGGLRTASLYVGTGIRWIDEP